MTVIVDDEAIERARQAGASVVVHTPVVSSATLSAHCGGEIVLKVESLQRTGSFKIRGAMSKVAALGEEARRGVVAGSAGNHAQAVAFAARAAGVPCEIYVPLGASIAKTEAARGYGRCRHASPRAPSRTASAASEVIQPIRQLSGR